MRREVALSLRPWAPPSFGAISASVRIYCGESGYLKKVQYTDGYFLALGSLRGRWQFCLATHTITIQAGSSKTRLSHASPAAR